jgi:tight adherence protein C
MTGVLLAGAGAGIGLVGLLAALRRGRPSLSMIFQSLDRDIPVAREPQSPRHFPTVMRPDLVMGERVAQSLAGRPLVTQKFAVATSLTGTSLETLCSKAVLGAAGGLLAPICFWGVVTLGGLRLPLAVPAWVALLSAVAGAAVPFVSFTSEVRRRRRTARKVIGSFLDLVVLCLAGGMGIEGALHAAARVGDDQVSARLLDALMLARDAGETPWNALAALGRDLGIGELVELAAAVSLAGTQGARIRSTLAAKAASVRRHELAEEEAEANRITERLFLPGVLMLLGFLLFIGYPAVARIMSGL